MIKTYKIQILRAFYISLTDSGWQFYENNEDDFRFILIEIELLNRMDILKHRSQEKLSIENLLFDYY